MSRFLMGWLLAGTMPGTTLGVRQRQSRYSLHEKYHQMKARMMNPTMSGAAGTTMVSGAGNMMNPGGSPSENAEKAERILDRIDAEYPQADGLLIPIKQDDEKVIAKAYEDEEIASFQQLNEVPAESFVNVGTGVLTALHQDATGKVMHQAKEEIKDAGQGNIPLAAQKMGDTLTAEEFDNLEGDFEGDDDLFVVEKKLENQITSVEKRLSNQIVSVEKKMEEKGAFIEKKQTSVVAEKKSTPVVKKEKQPCITEPEKIPEETKGSFLEESVEQKVDKKVETKTKKKDENDTPETTVTTPLVDATRPDEATPEHEVHHPAAAPEHEVLPATDPVPTPVTAAAAKPAVKPYTSSLRGKPSFLQDSQKEQNKASHHKKRRHKKSFLEHTKGKGKGKEDEDEEDEGEEDEEDEGEEGKPKANAGKGTKNAGNVAGDTAAGTTDKPLSAGQALQEAALNEAEMNIWNYVPSIIGFLIVLLLVVACVVSYRSGNAENGERNSQAESGWAGPGW